MNRINRAVLISLLFLSALFLACRAKPPVRHASVPIATRDTSKENLNRYIEAYENSPELAARERAMIDRRLELRNNWAINRALEKGSIRVRAVAPPLQLTGDDSVDENRTYQILLVADDLPAGHQFLDEYEVRVGPEASKAVVLPGAAAENLQEADVQYVEERLNLLKADRNLLEADHAFMTNYLELAKARLDEIGEAMTNTYNQITNEISLTLTNIAAITNEIYSLKTNIFALSTNIISEKRKLADPSGAAASEVALPELERTVSEFQEKQVRLGEAESRHRTLVRYVGELRQQEQTHMRKMVSLSNFESRPAGLKSSVGALSIQIDFWTAELAARKLLAQQEGRSQRYEMKSAATVQFRGAALKRTPQITIDVIRKIPRGLSSGTEPELAIRIKEDLKQTEDRLQQLRKYLVSLSNRESPRRSIVHFDAAIQRIRSDLVPLRGRLEGHANAIPVQTNNIGDAMDWAQQLKQAATNLSAFTNALAKMRVNIEGASLAMATASTNLASLRTANLEPASNVGTALATIESELRPSANVLSNLLLSLQVVTSNATAFIDPQSYALQLAPDFESTVPLRQRPDQVMNQNMLIAVALTTNIARISQDLTDVRTALSKRLSELQSLALERNTAIAAATNSLVSAMNSIANAVQEAARNMEGVSEAERQLQRLASSLSNLLAKQEIQRSFRRQNELHSNLVAIADDHLAAVTGCLEAFNGDSGEKFDRHGQCVVYVDKCLHEVAKARSMIENLSLRGDSLDFLGLNNRSFNEGRPGEFLNDPQGTFARIERGDLAIFRFNVLRGVVSTTAFLIPDDAAAKLFGGRFVDQFYVSQVTFRNPDPVKPILIYGNTMRLIVRMTAASTTEVEENGKAKRLNWWATYEPLDFDNVKRVLEQSNERTWRKWISKGIDYASMLGGIGAAFTSSLDFARGVGLFSGTFAPATKTLLEEDLIRYDRNFRELGLNNIEEIPAGGILTRHVFLPKGPIFGDHDYDPDAANDLGLNAGARNWPFGKGADDFGRAALRPSYIYNIRREEVYVEGKRILQSDPLTSAGIR